MDPDLPSVSRRQFIGGLAGVSGVGGSGMVAAGAKRPTALPKFVADVATKHYPRPPAPSVLWRPTVTEEHAREAVTLLADTQAELDERRRDVEDDAFLHGAGGWLSSAEEALEAGEYHEALSDARYGMQFAAGDLGEARAKLGVDDLEALAERSLALEERTDALVDEVDGYPVVDPERDLAWYVRVEAQAQLGRHLADWNGRDEILGLDDGGVEDGSNGTDQDGTGGETDQDVPDYEPSGIGRITSGVLRAEIAVESAERYHALLREKLGGSSEDYRTHLESVGSGLRDELEAMPTRDEVRARYVGEEGPPSPYQFAHYRLSTWCFPADLPVSVPWEHPLDEDFLLLEVLGLSRGLVDWRAHEDAVEELAVSPGDEGFHSGHVLAEQRRARAAFRDVVGSDPTPFTVVLSEPGVGSVRNAEVHRSWGDSEHWEPWNARVQAYCYALLGRARLREYPDVYDRIVDGG